MAPSSWLPYERNPCRMPVAGDVAELCGPGHLDVLLCKLQPHGVKTKLLCHFRWNCLPNPQRGLLDHAGVSGHFSMLYFSSVRDNPLRQHTQEQGDKADKASFPKTPSCLSSTLEFGLAKMNSCIWDILWGVSPRNGEIQNQHSACSVSQCRGTLLSTGGEVMWKPNVNFT